MSFNKTKWTMKHFLTNDFFFFFVFINKKSTKEIFCI